MMDLNTKSDTWIVYHYGRAVSARNRAAFFGAVHTFESHDADCTTLWHEIIKRGICGKPDAIGNTAYSREYYRGISDENRAVYESETR